jgi:protein disulfide-isomerase/protein disulfide isomerase family A protein 5
MMNDKNFYDEINDKKFMLTMFYAPWCGHCTRAAPEYKAAAAELLKDDPPAYLGVVNGDLGDSKGIQK